MGMTLTEKIMARASGRDELRAGEIVYPKADLATIHDLYVLYVVDADRQLTELGVERPGSRPYRWVLPSRGNRV